MTDREDDKKRVGEPHPLGDAVDLFEKNDLEDAAPKSFGWTEEQWAKHDAEVAAERDAQRAIVEESVRGPLNLDGTECGWPKRTIDIAYRADRTYPAVKLLLEDAPRRPRDPRQKTIVVISGTRGCGKTIAAAVWAIDRDIRARFIRASTFAAMSRFDADARARIFQAPALVVDDMGAEYIDAKGSFLTDLDELVDTFYGDGRTLIMTTNLEADDFAKRYKERVMDRFRECGEWLSTSAKSFRGATP